MDECPLYKEYHKFFSTHITCNATDEDLRNEQELIEEFCLTGFKKCVRYKTYQDLKVEYLVRKKLETQYGA